MGNEWEIEIWTNDHELLDLGPASDGFAGYAWVQVERGDGWEELIPAIARVSKYHRPIRIYYRGFYDAQ